MKRFLLLFCFCVSLFCLPVLAQHKTQSVLIFGVVHSYKNARSIPDVTMKVRKKILFLSVYKKFSSTSDLGSFSFKVSVDSASKLESPMLITFTKKGYEKSTLLLSRASSSGYLVYMTAKRKLEKQPKKGI